MENRIQELTEKIYNEGLEKGKKEAARLVAEAQERSAAIVAEAQAEAEKIMTQAQKNADALQANSRSELKLYASQAVGALKSEVANMVTDIIVSAAVKEAFAGDALKNVLLRIADRWSADEPLVISTAEAQELQSYFAAKAKNLLDKGVEIKQVNGLKTSFSIAPADGSYKVNFGEAEFEAFLKSFLRPQIVEQLF